MCKYCVEYETIAQLCNVNRHDMNQNFINPEKILDQFDLGILEILQHDNKTSQREIGKAINLSAPAVQRRIKRMEESGVIQSNIAVIDPLTVGRELTLIANVEMENERSEFLESAKHSFSKAPEVQQCYYTTGETDFVLIITVKTMSEYEALTQRLFFENNNVKRFRTFVTMDRIKVGMDIPLI